MKKIFLPALFVFSLANAQGQVQKTYHQIFEIGQPEYIVLDLADDFEIITWAANNIMIESTIQLENTQQHVLDFVIKQEGRYNIRVLQGTDNSVTLQSLNLKRQPLIIQKIECPETVLLKVYIPDTYNISEKKRPVIIRSAEESQNR